MPYSVEEIYGIRESGKYATIKQTYNELYRIYGINVDDLFHLSVNRNEYFTGIGLEKVKTTCYNEKSTNYIQK